MFSCFWVSKYLVKLVMVMPRISRVSGSLLMTTWGSISSETAFLGLPKLMYMTSAFLS